MSKPVGPYTPIVRAGDWLVVSGQVGLADGKLVAGGVEAELRQAIANLSDLLVGSRARRSPTSRRRRCSSATSASDYAAMNEVYMELFGDHRPARSAIGVAELPLGALWRWKLGPRRGRMTACSAP